MLPMNHEPHHWNQRSNASLWAMVDRSERPRDIAARTWLGKGHWRRRNTHSALVDRLVAQAVATSRVVVSNLGAHEPEAPRSGSCWMPNAQQPGAWADRALEEFPESADRFHRWRDFWSPATTDQRDVLRAWQSIAPAQLREESWRSLERLVSAIALAVRCYGPSTVLTASLIVRAMLASGLDSSLRMSPPELPSLLEDAVTDFIGRVTASQAQDEVECKQDVHRWLQFRLGTEPERARAARTIPPALVESLGASRARLNWRQLVDWAEKWHSPEISLRALGITATGNRFELATPLILEADLGASLPENTRLIQTSQQLQALATQERHCIASFMAELQRGSRHVLVIEDHHNGHRERSSLMIAEQVLPDHWQPQLASDRPYSIRDLKMRDNRKSPERHARIARDLVASWNALASQHSIMVGPEETVRRRSARRRRSLSTHQLKQYWEEVTAQCIPDWLRDFDPELGLLQKLAT